MVELVVWFSVSFERAVWFSDALGSIVSLIVFVSFCKIVWLVSGRGKLDSFAIAVSFVVVLDSSKTNVEFVSFEDAVSFAGSVLFAMAFGSVGELGNSVSPIVLLAVLVSFVRLASVESFAKDAPRSASSAEVALHAEEESLPAIVLFRQPFAPGERGMDANSITSNSENELNQPTPFQRR